MADGSQALTTELVQSPIGKLYQALSAAQGEFPEIPRRRVAHVKLKNGGGYSYNYADLSDVLRAVTPVLSAHGLALMQWPEDDVIVTTLGHLSGAEKRAEWPIKPMPARGLEDAQSFQSAVQVAKRYAAQAILGISSEETLEGDFSGRRSEEPQLDDNFKSGDGVRMPIGAVWDKEKSNEENARAACDAIIEQFKKPATAQGVNGTWNRNQMFIDKFEKSYPALHADILDAFHVQMQERDK